MSQAAELNITTDEWPLIEPGPYQAVIRGWRTSQPFKAEKLVLELDVLVPGEEGKQRTVRLNRYYNVRRTKGRLHASPATDFYREWVLITGRRPTRRGRLAASALVNVMVEVRVETVTQAAPRGGRRRPLPEGAHYSVVREILSVIAGGHPR